MAERWLASGAPATARRWLHADRISRHGLETAAEYLNAGLWQDGMAVLERAVQPPTRPGFSPMVYYYLGDFADRLGQAQKAAGYYRLAASAARLRFPFPV